MSPARLRHASAPPIKTPMENDITVKDGKVILLSSQNHPKTIPISPRNSRTIAGAVPWPLHMTGSFRSQYRSKEGHPKRKGALTCTAPMRF